MPQPPTISTLFPYTTLFRSHLLIYDAKNGDGDNGGTQTDSRFDMKTFTELKNAQSITIAYDGLNPMRSEEHTSELQSPDHLVCRLLLEKKKKIKSHITEKSI